MNNSLRKIFRGDTLVWAVFIILVVFSVLQVFSAISYLAYQNVAYDSPIKTHIQMLLLGIAALFCFTHVKYFRPTTKFFRGGSYIGLLFAWGMLLYLLSKGEKIGDAARWFAVLGFSIQPSEFAKFFLIITIADMLDTTSCMLAKVVSFFRGGDFTFNSRQQFIIIVILVGITCILIAVENLSTAVLLGTVVLVMLCMSKIAWKKIAMLLGGVVLVVLFCWGISKLVPEDVKSDNKIVGAAVSFLHRFPTWESRIVEFFKPDDENKYKVTDKNRQVVHAQRAIARGGFMKFGPGTSIERDYLPNAYNDFIYAIVIEEYGLLGGGVIILLFLVLLSRAPSIAFRQKSDYATLLVFGSVFIIVFQALINMAVSVKLGPVTGQPLPLVGKGGSSILFVSIYFGIILNLSDKENNDESLIEINNSNEDEFQILD